MYRTWDNLLQSLFHPVQADCSQNRGKYLGAIGVNNQRQAKDISGISCFAQGQKLRGKKCRWDSGGDPHVRTQLLSRGRTHHYREEVKDRLEHGVSQTEAFRLLIQRRTEVLNTKGVRQDQQHDDERGAQQCPENWAEGIRKKLEAVIYPVVLATNAVVLLLGGRRFLTGSVYTGLLDDFVVVVSNAATHDYLVAVGALWHGA